MEAHRLLSCVRASAVRGLRGLGRLASRPRRRQLRLVLWLRTSRHSKRAATYSLRMQAARYGATRRARASGDGAAQGRATPQRRGYGPCTGSDAPVRIVGEVAHRVNHRGCILEPSSSALILDSARRVGVLELQILLGVCGVVVNLARPVVGARLGVRVRRADRPSCPRSSFGKQTVARAAMHGGGTGATTCARSWQPAAQRDRRRGWARTPVLKPADHASCTTRECILERHGRCHRHVRDPARVVVGPRTKTRRVICTCMAWRRRDDLAAGEHPLHDGDAQRHQSARRLDRGKHCRGRRRVVKPSLFGRGRVRSFHTKRRSGLRRADGARWMQPPTGIRSRPFAFAELARRRQAGGGRAGAHMCGRSRDRGGVGHWRRRGSRDDSGRRVDPRACRCIRAALYGGARDQAKARTERGRAQGTQTHARQRRREEAAAPDTFQAEDFAEPNPARRAGVRCASRACVSPLGGESAPADRTARRRASGRRARGCAHAGSSAKPAACRLDGVGR